MAFKLLPKTRENTTTVGTGALTLVGAVAADNLTFGAQMSEGDQTFACALSTDGSTWEEGLYTMTSGQLARTGPRLATSALGTSAVALDGGRVWGIIPHDILLLLAKLLAPVDSQVVKYDAGLGRFVTASVGGVSWHQAVALATAAALPGNTYSNGTAGVGATLTASGNAALSVDGVAVTAGNRILVKDEATQAHNGIYVVTAAGDGSHPYVLTRATDYDDAGDIGQSDATVVGTAGTANGSTVWLSTIGSPFTLGTSTISFSLVISLPPITSDGDVLTIVSGVPTWSTPSGGGGSWAIDGVGNWASDGTFSAGDVSRDRADFYQVKADLAPGPGVAPDIDGNNVAAATGTTGPTAITTASAGDLIYLLFATKDSGGHMTGVTSSLTFTQLFREVAGAYSLELWSAPAASALTAEAITANFSASINYVVHVFAVKGNHALVPLDRNTSLPRYGSSGSSLAGVSTSSPFDILFYFDMTDNPSGFDGTLAPSGFTWVQGTSYIPAQSSLSYKRVTATQSNITLDAANGPASQTFAFAVTSDNPPPRLDPEHWVRLSGFDSTAFDVVLGSAVGNIAVRQSAGWGVLAPGTAGQVINFGTAGPQVVNFSAALDALSTTPGAIVQRGTAGYGVIAPGTSGQVLTMGTSGVAATFEDNGGGGGGGGAGSVPTQASTGFTSSANLGGVATVSDSAAGVLISQPASNGNAENWRIVFKAQPATPYAIRAKIALLSSFVFGEHVAIGLGFYDGTKLEYIGLHIGGVNPGTALGTIQLGDYSSVSSSFGSSDSATFTNSLWVQIENDGSSLHFGISIDGVTYRRIKDETIGTFLTPTHIFFGINPYGSAAWGTLMDYAET